jgi:integrase
VIAHVSASWRSLNKKLEGKLGRWNPASAVDKDTIRPKRERILDENLPDYAARVATMRSPIKRDGLMVALYTGLRHEDVRTLRFELVDFDEQTMHLPNPKGGESKAFTIPLSKTPFAILQRRQRDTSSGCSGITRAGHPTSRSS